MNKNSIVTTTVLVAFLALGLAGPVAALAAGPAAVDLLSADNFVILSKTGITDVPSSDITGNIGTSPITGATIGPSCTEVSGTVYDNDGFYTGGFDSNIACRSTNAGLLTTAVSDMETAYTSAAGITLPDFTELGAGNIGGMTLAPGLYKWSTGVTIPTSVTLSGGASDVWVFQIAGDLSIASGGSVPAGIKVILTGGAQASNVFWQVGGEVGATLGTYSTFNGTILSAKQVIVQTGAVLCGKALAQTQVTLDQNTISDACSSFPPPSNNLTVTVTIDKFIDGEQATASSANNSSFPMSATWDAVNIGAGTGSYDLDADGFNGDPTPYQAITSEMTVGADYTTSEITGGSVVGASCSTGQPYALVGYSSGNTLADAITAGASATVPNLTNLQNDAFIIVWNEECAPPVDPSEIHGSKFFDINGNGVWDIGEVGLGGWTINLAGTANDSQVTDGAGDYGFTDLAAGSYTLSEVLQAGWTQTAAPGPITLGVGEVLNDQNFGNACFVGTNGKSKGYWTNKSGEATLKDGPSGFAPELVLLRDLNLKNKNGGNFDPTTYAQLKSWLNSADAINMAYMLSAQLTAVELSVEAGVTDASSDVVATNPLLASIPGMSPLGIISINDLMAAANAALGVDGLTLTGDANRAYQEALKNVLDKIATGQNIQVCPNVVVN